MRTLVSSYCRAATGGRSWRAPSDHVSMLVACTLTVYLLAPDVNWHPGDRSPGGVSYCAPSCTENEEAVVRQLYRAFSGGSQSGSGMTKYSERATRYGTYRR